MARLTTRSVTRGQVTPFRSSHTSIGKLLSVFQGRFVVEFGLLACQACETLFGGFSEKFLHRSQQHRDVHWFLQECAHARVDRCEKLVRARSGDDDGDERMLAGEVLKRVPAVLD